jgi:hypothetical protein
VTRVRRKIPKYAWDIPICVALGISLQTIESSTGTAGENLGVVHVSKEIPFKFPIIGNLNAETG